MPSLGDRIAEYRSRFCYVDETYCVQQPAGHYLRAYADPGTKERPQPLTDEMLERHLRGQATLAFYTAKRVGDQTLCREGIMETDDKRAIPDGRGVRYEAVNGREMMRAAHLRLEREGIASALELSRRGARVRVFAAEPVPARQMQDLLLFALTSAERERMARGETAVEINPKQADLPDGKVGSSVRGPFGVHRKSHERYPFILPDGRPVAVTLGGQIAYTLAVPTVDVGREIERRPWLAQEHREILERTPEQARTRPRERAPRLPGSENTSPIERWKERHPLADVLAAYGVVVRRTGTYSCPLPHHGHGDQHPSLSVDVERGVWFCHTQRVGGSQFDFVAAAEGLASPAETVAYLRGRGEIEAPAPERGATSAELVRGQ